MTLTASKDALAWVTRDLRKAGALFSPAEARYLVDLYYEVQEQRIRGRAQTRAMQGEPSQLFGWVGDVFEGLETEAKHALGAYAASIPVGAWSLSICGIGPVLAAGLLAHIDITKAPTVGHIWSFAGLNPTATWGKGQKRPWNARLKTLCWKIGESFVKVSSNDKDVYGQVYLQRKAQEIAKNHAGDFADQAAHSLATKSYGKATDAYQWYGWGMLPPARIHLRAERYAVKLFLSHWHDVAYRAHYGVAPPKPYPIAHLGHAHMIDVPCTTTEPQ